MATDLELQLESHVGPVAVQVPLVVGIRCFRGLDGLVGLVVISEQLGQRPDTRPARKHRRLSSLCPQDDISLGRWALLQLDGATANHQMWETRQSGSFLIPGLLNQLGVDSKADSCRRPTRVGLDTGGLGGSSSNLDRCRRNLNRSGSNLTRNRNRTRRSLRHSRLLLDCRGLPGHGLQCWNILNQTGLGYGHRNRGGSSGWLLGGGPWDGGLLDHRLRHAARAARRGRSLELHGG